LALKSCDVANKNEQRSSVSLGTHWYFQRALLPRLLDIQMLTLLLSIRNVSCTLKLCLKTSPALPIQHDRKQVNCFVSGTRVLRPPPPIACHAYAVPPLGCSIAVLPTASSLTDLVPRVTRITSYSIQPALKQFIGCLPRQPSATTLSLRDQS
jgi:hypothetical protein